MFWATGKRFRYVTIRPSTAGHIGHLVPYNLHRDQDLNTVAECHDEMERSAAGHIARRRFSSGEPYTDGQLASMFARALDGFGDQDQIRFAARIGAGMDDEFYRDVPQERKGPRSWIPVWRDAEAKLIARWPAVKAVACLLEARRTLSGRDVFEIAAAAMRDC